MDRRGFLKSAAMAGMGVSGGLARPLVARAAGSRVLRFVPQANLTSFDPIWTPLPVVRNAGMLCFDTLYGLDSQLRPQPQMCAGHTVSADRLTWTFTLRDGLNFHDGTPVLARDCVASIHRWMARDSMGQMIQARLRALAVVNDRSFRLTLAAPFPKMLYALGKIGTPVCFIMPEAIARTDPFEPIGRYVGSGPFRFRADEWVPGVAAVFERFTDYVPRMEKASWMAGGKRVNFDRVEWKIIANPATAAAALQSGEVDWWERPTRDVIRKLQADDGVAVGIADPLGNIGDCRFNHLYPPFSDARVRRAMLMAANQDDYMRAIVGDDPALWADLPGFFTPGTACYTTAGGRVLTERNIAAARALIQQAGHAGTKVVMLVGTDVPVVKAQSDVTADLMQKIGLRVDYVATDWAALAVRRASKAPPDKGGWNVFHTAHAGIDCVTPAAYVAIFTSGEKAWFGWPDSPPLQARVDGWFDATGEDVHRQMMDEINIGSAAFATYLPTGFFKHYQAWRTSLSGVGPAPFPVPWDVTGA